MFAVLASAIVGAAVPGADAPWIHAARKVVPGEVPASELRQAVQGGLWNTARTAVVFVLSRPKGSQVVVLLHPPDGACLAVDVSRVEEGNFGKLGRPRTEFSRYETTPVRWLSREDGLFQVRLRTRAWRGGQRFTVSEDLLLRSDGTVLYR